MVEYGRKKGVDLIMHHETSSAVTTYDKQLDTAFALISSLNLHMVKTGYVGKIIPKGEYHHGQWMVNHYRRVLEVAAKHKVAVDVHEPFYGNRRAQNISKLRFSGGIPGTGVQRMSSDGGNPPEHLAIIPFTCLLAGLGLYTGNLQPKLKPYKPNNQVNNTLAQQLALYVVIYSPIQMAADLPENYENHPAIQFFRDVGVNGSKPGCLTVKLAIMLPLPVRNAEQTVGFWCGNR